jgi:hypothetical protein
MSRINTIIYDLYSQDEHYMMCNNNAHSDEDGERNRGIRR